SLELEREEAGALAGAKRVRRADPERRELRELLRARLLPRGVEELEDAERRPAERQRRGDGALLREPCDLRGDRPGLGERPLRDAACSAEIGVDADAPGGGRDELIVAALPEDRGDRPCDAGGQAAALGRGARLPD